MALPELAGHAALHEVIAKIKAAYAFLEGEQSELEDQLNRLSGLHLLSLPRLCLPKPLPLIHCRYFIFDLDPCVLQTNGGESKSKFDKLVPVR